MGTSIIDLLKFKFKFDPPIRRKKSKKKTKKTKKPVNPTPSTPEPIDAPEELPSPHVISSPSLPDLPALYDPAPAPDQSDANKQEVSFDEHVPVPNRPISPVPPVVVDPNDMIHPAFRDDNPTGMLAAEPIVPEDLCPFCDKLMPSGPSDTLVKMGIHLTKKRGFHETVDYCQRHEAEMDVIPMGLGKGWPSQINIDALQISPLVGGTEGNPI
ncbi:hypothetical protein PGTUg99_010783 [Puccinia graminis f. sp. tritici]|uniref:Uncharacterized protein n=1 Tax=Puccinia graminis f. sp. tritici TaxID=56615 RepID=A0A5B0LQD1_PUCGR|nr:hypothetical protein PGTUg99_010783 [Puccinia graminis f. sp. tritici]